MNSCEELEAKVRSVPDFRTSAYFKCGDFLAELRFTVDAFGKLIRAYRMKSVNSLSYDHAGADSVSEALQQLKAWLPDGILMTDTITIESKMEGLLPLVRTVWCETFTEYTSELQGQDVDPEACRKQVILDNLEHRRRIVLEHLEPLLRQGTSGVAKWNSQPESEKFLVDWSGKDFSNLNLKGVVLSTLKFNNVNFQAANLENSKLERSQVEGARFRSAKLAKSVWKCAWARGADFTESTLTGANLSDSDLRNAVFAGCDLSKAKLAGAELFGADLSDCKFDDKTDFLFAKYDESTKLPANFSRQRELLWRGQGPDPFLQMIEAKLQSDEELSYPDFIGGLEISFDFDKVKKALSMLKKEKFELFSEVNEDRLVAVIKSQTDPDLVYASKLTKEGAFSCCTQNLKVCGGLKGSLCKHNLVMIMGLVKHGAITANKATLWALATVQKDAKLIKDEMADIFIRYKGVTLGEVDWRPIETLPEDYHAF